MRKDRCRREFQNVSQLFDLAYMYELVCGREEDETKHFISLDDTETDTSVIFTDFDQFANCD